MELLRIIAMSMILLHHFMLKGLTPKDMPCHLYNALNGLVYVGVPVFFLLSGYFTIKYTFKGLVNLIVLIELYGLVNILALYKFGIIGGDILSAIFYPITGSPYWFMKVYLFLYITAPILNAGLRNLDKNRLRNTLILLVVASFYGHHFYAVDSYLHGMYLYCVGYYIARYKPYQKVRSRYWFIAFLLIMIFSGIFDWILTETGHPNTYFQSYRHILVFLGGIMLLLTFRGFKFSNKFINVIAYSSLGCYLLQDGYFGRMFLYQYQNHLLEKFGYSIKLFVAYTVLFFLLWMVACILHPILARISNFIGSFTEKIIADFRVRVQASLYR